MNPRPMTRTLAMLGLLTCTAAWAAPAVGVQMEVSFLLGFVEGSGCEFQRNGTWHDSKAAQEHLRDKYRYLAARDQIDTTEQFIERAATQSSITGQPYLVRCKSGQAITSRRWLTDELALMRARP